MNPWDLYLSLSNWLFYFFIILLRIRSHFPQIFIEAPTYQVLALSNLALVINKVLKSQIATHDKGYVVYYVYYVCYIIAHSASFRPCLDGGNTTTHHSSLNNSFLITWKSPSYTPATFGTTTHLEFPFPKLKILNFMWDPRTKHCVCSQLGYPHDLSAQTHFTSYFLQPTKSPKTYTEPISSSPLSPSGANLLTFFLHFCLWI